MVEPPGEVEEAGQHILSHGAGIPIAARGGADDIAAPEILASFIAASSLATEPLLSDPGTAERTSDHSYVASRGTRGMTANPSVRRLSLTHPGFRRPSALRSNMTRRRLSPRRTRRSWACLASLSRATTTNHVVTGRRRRRARCPAGGIAVLGTFRRLTLARWITADTAA
jgi:hypothetical protein